jgi:hypothetical protein
MFAASGYFIVLLFSVLEAAIVLALLQFRKWLKRLDANSLLAISNESEYFVTAGRSLKTGVVSNAIVAQWTWAATLLQRFDSTQLQTRFLQQSSFSTPSTDVRVQLQRCLAIRHFRRAIVTIIIYS